MATASPLLLLLPSSFVAELAGVVGDAEGARARDAHRRAA